jgi:predicted RNA-binding Zn-ribbon protein involved in translation (DUF1610 family)
VAEPDSAAASLSSGFKVAGKSADVLIRPVRYRSTCPQCGTVVRRAQYISTFKLDYTCRACGALFRFTALGHLVALAFLVASCCLFSLMWNDVLSPLTMVCLASINLFLLIWLMPCLTPMKLKMPAPPNHDARSIAPSPLPQDTTRLS